MSIMSGRADDHARAATAALTPDDASRIAEIHQRLAGATPGPWSVQADSTDERTIRANGPIVSGVVATVRVAWVHSRQRNEQAANADFIAHARADLDWAIARLGATMPDESRTLRRTALCDLLNRAAGFAESEGHDNLAADLRTARDAVAERG